MELRQLRYFLAVAEELNFTRAARRAGIAQPPLSQQIKALESELGASLFLRTKRHVKLTESGAALVAHARRTLQCADDARAAVQSGGQGLRGTISIGAIYTAAYTLVPKILRAFREAYPLVSVQLQEMSIAEQHVALEAGRIDAGLLRPPLSNDRLAYTTLFEEPFVAVIPARHKLRGKRSVSLADLAAEPFVSLPRVFHGSVGAVAADMFTRHGLRTQVVQEVAEMHTLICLVASGVGVSVVPASISGIRMSDILYRPIIQKTPLTPVCLATNRSSASTILPHFADTVGRVFAED